MSQAQHNVSPTPAPRSRNRQTISRAYAGRVLLTAGLVALIGVLLFLAWQVAEVLLLGFAGLLLAVLLRGLADRVSTHTPIKGGWALGLVLLVLATLIGAAVWFLGGRIAAEIDQLQTLLPQAINDLGDTIRGYAWGQALLNAIPPVTSFAGGQSDLLGRVTGILSTASSLLINFGLVLFVGIYLAAEPHFYIRGLIRLIPQRGRDRARDILAAEEDILRSWLLGQLFMMVTIGIAKGLGLWLLGVPLALTLGVLAGLLEFIPNVGPLTAGSIATLIALTQSPTKAIYVLIFTIALQTTESNILEPIVQRYAVKLPPVLVIIVQVAAAVLFGFSGLLVATPLLAAIFVLVKKIYVEDTLHDYADDEDDRSDSPDDSGTAPARQAAEP